MELPISALFKALCFRGVEICLPLKYKLILLLWFLFTWNTPLCFTFTWPFLALCKHRDLQCFDICICFHLSESGNVKKSMEMYGRFIFFQVLLKMWDILASSCIESSNFRAAHSLLPVQVSEYPMRLNSVAVSKQITVFPGKCDWITAAVSPVFLEDESASEMCSCGQYMELGGPVL